MRIEFEPNEFTTYDLMEYLNRAYGSKVNGRVFRAIDLHNWARLKKIPEVYGGNRILKVTRYKQFENIRVYTIDNLYREDVIRQYGDLSTFKTNFVHSRVKEKQIKQIPPAQRTKSSYELAVRKGYAPPFTNPIAILPDNYRLLGIKSNQISQCTKRIVKKSKGIRKKWGEKYEEKLKKNEEKVARSPKNRYL